MSLALTIDEYTRNILGLGWINPFEMGDENIQTELVVLKGIYYWYLVDVNLLCNAYH